MPRARSDAARIPAAEWLAAAVGCALLLLSVGTLLREALWGDSSPPDIRVTLESVERQSESYLVRFRAVNRGGTTAVPDENGALHAMMAGAALGHPVSRMWKGYWQRPN